MALRYEWRRINIELTQDRPTVWRPLPVRRRLNRVELCILSAPCDERIVRSRLDNASAVGHDDEIGHPHGGEAV
jgi:hypothetical protein